jgi:hypothetical protein
VLLSLLASAIPLAAAQPVWWLQLFDAAVNLAPVLLLAVMVLRVGDVLLDSDADEALISGRCSHQQASRWAFLFALLVPLQLIGFAWLWADSSTARSTARSTRANAAASPCAAASRPAAPRLSWVACSPPPTRGPCRPCRPAAWPSGNSSSARRSTLTLPHQQQPPRSTRRDAAPLPARHPARVVRGGDRESLSVHAQAPRRSGASVARGTAAMASSDNRQFALPGIKGGHTGGGEVAQVPAHHGEAVLQSGGGDQQIGASWPRAAESNRQRRATGRSTASSR